MSRALILPGEECFWQQYFSFASPFPDPCQLRIRLSCSLSANANPNPSSSYEPGAPEEHSILQRRTLLAALCLLWQPFSIPTLATALRFLSALTLRMGMVLHSQEKQTERALSRIKDKYNKKC